MKTGLDMIDEQILNILQTNARTTMKEIASTVFLSSPAVTSRIERMERKGIIEGYHAQISRTALGYRTKAFVGLNLEANHHEEFEVFLQTAENVIACNSVTGEYGILMEVAFPSNEELDRFVSKLQHYGKTSVQIILGTSVKHRGLPVEYHEA